MRTGRGRKPPPAPEPVPCGCAERVAELEALAAALAAAIVALRPRSRRDSVEQGLMAWHVAEPDARLIGGVLRERAAAGKGVIPLGQ